MTVILRCRLDNCVRLFNQINHDDRLMSIKALILTALLQYYGSGPNCRPETGKWTAGSFSENMKGAISNTHIYSQLFQSFQVVLEQQPHACAWRNHTEKNKNPFSLINIYNLWKGQRTPEFCSPDECLLHICHEWCTCMYSRWINDHLKFQIQPTIQE